MDTPVEKHRLIARSVLFQNVPDEQLIELARYAKSKQIPARQEIFRRGEKGSQMYIIVSGRVSFHTDSETGQELIFRFLGAGDIFGEIALLDGGERTATARTVEDTLVLIIERRDFLPFLEKHPKVAITLLASVAASFRTMGELFEDTYFRNLPSRLAKRFLALKDSYGVKTSQGIQISIKLSQGDIGKLAGATRETINKQLKAWEDEGIVAVDNGYIVLRNIARLEDLSTH